MRIYKGHNLGWRFRVVSERREGAVKWFVVSDIYEPARAGFVGSGWFDARPHETHKQALIYGKAKY
jgi:hypothetical protein